MGERLTAEQRRRLQGIVETAAQYQAARTEPYWSSVEAVYVWEALPDLLAELERVEGERDALKAERALQSLTPGGSDFQTVESCIRWIEHNWRESHRLLVEQSVRIHSLEDELKDLREAYLALERRNYQE